MLPIVAEAMVIAAALLLVTMNDGASELMSLNAAAEPVPRIGPVAPVFVTPLAVL